MPRVFLIQFDDERQTVEVTGYSHSPLGTANLRAIEARDCGPAGSVLVEVDKAATLREA